MGFVQAFITLFIMLDPLGNLPIFYTLTSGGSPSSVRWFALKTALVCPRRCPRVLDNYWSLSYMRTFQYLQISSTKSAKLQVSTITLGLAAVGGKALFDTIGITMPAFRVAGGILLFLFSLEMLFEKKTDRQIELATSVLEHLKALKVAIGRKVINIPPCLLHQ